MGNPKRAEEARVKMQEAINQLDSQSDIEISRWV
jgi:hypothetical protein